MTIVALLTAVAFSVAPALQVSRLNLTEALKDGGAGAWSRRYLRNALVVTEVALAFVLLVGAGLMARTLANLLNVETGFNSDNVVTVPLAPANDIATNPERAGVFYSELQSGLIAQPGTRRPGSPHTSRWVAMTREAASVSKEGSLSLESLFAHTGA